MPADDLKPILLVDGHVDPLNGTVHRADSPERTLSTVELALLKRLVADAGEAVSREQLLVDVWDLDPMTLTRTVDTAIKRLRRKLEQDPRNPRHVVTVHRTGYVFRPPTRRATGWEAAQDALRNTRSPVCTLVAPAGAGKTWLLRQTFGDDVPIVPLTGSATATDLLVALTALARITSDDPAAYLRASGAERVVLDGVDGVRDAVGDLARAVGSQAGMPQLVLAASRPLDVPDENVISLGPLDDDAAMALFVAHSGVTPDRVPADLLTWAAGHPLAIRIAAEWLGRLGEAGIRPLLDELDELPIPDVSPGDVRSVAQAVRATLDRLEPEEASALRALCTVKDAFRPTDVGALTGLSTAEALRHVQRLVLAGLITVDEGAHRVTRLVRNTLEPSEDDWLRHAEWVSRGVRAHTGDVLSDPAAISALNTLLPDGLRAITTLRTHDAHAATELALGLWPVFVTRAPNPVATEVFATDPPQDAAPDVRALYLARRAELQRVRGHRTALAATLELANEQGLTCPELDFVHAMFIHMQGKLEEAARAYGALTTSDSIRVRLQARVALVYARDGILAGIEATLAEVSDITREAEEHGLRYVQGVALSLLGRNEHAVGLLSQARTDLEQAHAIMVAFGDARMQAQCSWALGLLDLEVSDPTTALEHFTEVHALADAHGLAELGVLGRLGHAQTALVCGDPGEAHALLLKTTQHARYAGAQHTHHSVLVWLAAALHRLGRDAEARAQLAPLPDSPATTLVRQTLDGVAPGTTVDPDMRLLIRALTGSSGSSDDTSSTH